MQASLQNARKSKGEPLNQRFDVLQQRAWMSDQFEVGLQSLNPVLAHPVCDSLM